MHDDRRRPRLGYLLAAVAAAMFAVNGSIAKLLLEDGVSAAHLSQLRVTVAFVLLAGALALVDRRRLRIARADVPRMAWLGFAGVAIVQFSYFLAIERLPISVALVIQFTGPLMVLLWLRPRARAAAAAVALRRGRAVGGRLGARGRGLRRRLRSTGSASSSRWSPRSRFAIYLIGFERAGHSYDAFTTLTWGLGFATLFWLLVSPPWTFPLGELRQRPQRSRSRSASSLIGTLVPFLLNVSALRHLPAARVGVVATLEPPLAAADRLDRARRGARPASRSRARTDGGRRRRLGAEPRARPRGRGGTRPDGSGKRPKARPSDG